MNEIVDNMHRSRFLSVIAFFMIMVHTLPVMANWAGPDQKVLRKVDNSQTVTLSVLTPGGYCYRWSGPNILTDRNQPTIQANPTEEQSIYICLRIGANGVEEDQVVVKVVDSIRIISVIPKKNCYSPEDPIDLEDFEIITEPEGYENLVTVSPIQVPNINGSWGLREKKEIDLTFCIDVYGNHSERRCSIFVINPNKVNHPISSDWLLLNHEIEQQFQKQLIEIKKIFDKKSRGGVNSDIFDMGTITYDWNQCECCNGNPIRTTKITWGGLGCGVSRDIYFPFGTFWGVVNAYGHFVPSINIYVGQTSLIFSNDPSCNRAEISVEFQGSVSGSVGVSLLSPKFLSVEGGVKGSASGTGKLYLPSCELNRKPIVLKCILFAQITVTPLWVWSPEYTLAEYEF